MLYIAYTREDALFVVQLTKDLDAVGIDVWLDLNELGPAADWNTAQEAAIEVCEGVIIVLSPEAMKREHMQHEIEQSFVTGKQVYLAVARRTPWRSWLKGLPVADFTNDYEAGLDALVLSVMGGQRAPDETLADAAELWLREAALHQQQQKSPARNKDQGDSKDSSSERKSLFSRLRRR